VASSAPVERTSRRSEPLDARQEHNETLLRRKSALVTGVIHAKDNIAIRRIGLGVHDCRVNGGELAARSGLTRATVSRGYLVAMATALSPTMRRLPWKPMVGGVLRLPSSFATTSGFWAAASLRRPQRSLASCRNQFREQIAAGATVVSGVTSLSLLLLLLLLSSFDLMMGDTCRSFAFGNHAASEFFLNAFQFDIDWKRRHWVSQS
jgi:hypothetical protein